MKIIFLCTFAAISYEKDQMNLIIYFFTIQTIIKLDFIVIRFLLYNYYLRETQMTNFMTLFILTLLWKVNV